jgi:limonene-1,2-epoxide hydrolase
MRWAVPLVLLLAGCTTPGAAEQAVCKAPPGERYVGKPATNALVERARKQAGAATVRVLRPGDIVAMIFLAERLSISVDGDNRVTKLVCG